MCFSRLLSSCSGLLLVLASTGLLGADDPKPGKSAGPLSPKDELATFRVPKGFRVELVAAEPDVVDPVAIAFDEDGRMFVAEMRGYPNDGLGTGMISSGKIKLLEDPDEKGMYRKATTYADGLRFPTSMQPWKGGLLVTVAPDIIYLEGKQKAEKQRTLYSGFGTYNIQGMVNGLQWGLDNWVYVNGGTNPSTVRSEEKKDAAPIELRGRGARFHPDVPGSLEPTSGGGQFGLCTDDWQHWFTATNSQHLRQIVLPDHYLRRNPYLPVSAVTIDIPDGVDGHGAVCKVHRISPFEGWRVERTTMRKDSPDSKRFPPTELFPGGYITSACSPLIYTADLFPETYRNCSYVCEPANNLIHRDILVPNGVVYSAKRADADCEFLASTDIWFRPVNLTLGPDGAIYVCDFYREVIETPLSLTPELKKKLPLHTQGKGRIWRIVPENAPAYMKPALGKAKAEDLVKELANPNPWWRLTAQRVLVERGGRAALSALKKLTEDGKTPQARAHALWTLSRLAVGEAYLLTLFIEATGDRVPEVREQGLRMIEMFLPYAEVLPIMVFQLAKDDSPRVRFQLALTLGSSDRGEAAFGLAKILRRDFADPWTQAAVLSSSAKHASTLLESLADDKEFVNNASPAKVQLLSRLATIVGAQAKEADLTRALKLLSADREGAAAWQVGILEGLGHGQQMSGHSLRKLWDEPPAALKDAVQRAQPFFKRAAITAHDGKKPIAERLAAARLLGYGPFTVAAESLQELLAPKNPSELQLAAVRALAGQDNAKVGPMLLEPWGGYSPAVRREVLEAVFARADRLGQLLDAIEKKKVLAAQLEPARVAMLRTHKDAELRKRAEKLLAGQVAPDRQKVINEYKPALDLKADVAKGKMVFQKVCSTCHRLENEGKEVGPDLLSALRTKTPEALLIDILDPSREVDARYITYIVSTKAGRLVTGMIAVESPSSITLRRANKEEEDVLRNQIDEIQATAKSLMPDELEKQLTKQDLADVIGYLRSVAAPK
jgi:putative membrane-bound dehydrogenase-like protein